jgi:hypothetical protein
MVPKSQRKGRCNRSLKTFDRKNRNKWRLFCPKIEDKRTGEQTLAD